MEVGIKQACICLLPSGMSGIIRHRRMITPLKNVPFLCFVSLGTQRNEKTIISIMDYKKSREEYLGFVLECFDRRCAFCFMHGNQRAALVFVYGF